MKVGYTCRKFELPPNVFCGIVVGSCANTNDGATFRDIMGGVEFKQKRCRDKFVAKGVLLAIEEGIRESYAIWGIISGPPR